MSSYVGGGVKRKVVDLVYRRGVFGDLWREEGGFRWRRRPDSDVIGRGGRVFVVDRRPGDGRARAGLCRGARAGVAAVRWEGGRGARGASVDWTRRWRWRAHGGRDRGWRLCLPALEVIEDLFDDRGVSALASCVALPPPSLESFDAGDDPDGAPPQRVQVSISTWNTRLSRCAQVMAAWRSAAVLGEPGPRRGPRRAGVTCARRLWLGANTPWNRVRLTRGVGTKAARRAMKVERFQDNVCGAVSIRGFQPVAHVALACQ